MENRIMKNVITTLIVTVLIASVLTVPLAVEDGIYAATKVKVTYKANKGKFTAKKYKNKKSFSKKITKGKKLGTTPKIKRSGYVFLGWTTKKNGTKKYTKSTKVKKSVTLYAKWGKKFKKNTKYTSLLERKFSSIAELEAIVGKLTPVPAAGYNGKIYVDGIDNYYYLETLQLVALYTEVRYVTNAKKAYPVDEFMKLFGQSKYHFGTNNGTPVVYWYGKTRYWAFDYYKAKKKIYPTNGVFIDTYL